MKNKWIKGLYILISVILILALLPTTALADDAGDFTVMGGTLGTTYTYLPNTLTFLEPGDYIVEMRSDVMHTVTDKVMVNASGSSADNPVHITLSGVDIRLSSGCAFEIASGSYARLTLSGDDNRLTSGPNCAGLHVVTGANLTIDAIIPSDDYSGYLLAEGGNHGAGIGGSNGEDGGNVTIASGCVTARNYDSAAGIGGGYGGNGGTVVISGGDVTASSANSGAGIGGGGGYGGNGGDGGSVTISGGSVSANGATDGAGIGGGLNGDGGSITISGGRVLASANYNGAGIGGGLDGGGGTIDISGGVIDAQGGEGGAGVGGGNGGDGGSITISGGKLIAVSRGYGAGIGGGQFGGGGTIDISGTADIVARGDNYGSGIGQGAGIGGGMNGGGGTINISGEAVVKATGGSYAAGIGGGSEGDGHGGTISIFGTANVYARGGGNAAGIGGGKEGNGGTISISGTTTIDTAGGDYGAGIGGGYAGDGGTVTLSGGVIFADGKNGGKDIGAGYTGSGGTLNLSGTAALFLRNDSCVTPTTTTHTHADVTDPANDMYGIPNTAGWAGGFGAYLNLCSVTYVTNGGSGAPGTLMQLFGTKLTKPADPSRANHTFLGWYADAALTDEWNFDMDTVTPDLHLYAKWHVNTFNISAVTNNAAYGSVSGGGTYNNGASVTLTATPKAGCQFVRWTENGAQVSTSTSYTFTATKNKSLTAEFAINAYAISVSANNAAYGSVSGDGTFNHGTSVTLIASPNAGYHFVRWTEGGSEVSASTEYSFAASADRALVAVFEKDADSRPVQPAVIPVGVSCTKTDVTQYGGSNGSVTVSASGGNSGLYEYSINGGVSWQGSGSFGGLAAGTYTAAVRDAGNTSNTATCSVTVGQPSHFGTVPANKVSSKANAGTAVTVVAPAAPKGYTVVSTTYTSTNPSVVAVDINGNVTFLSGGKATIITKVISQMTDSKGRVKTKTTTVKKSITVKQPIASISLNLKDTTIARTQKVKLAPVFAPATASDKKVKWTSSNPKVAAVSSSGVVTGKAGGTAIITCTAKDGSGVSAGCTVTVTPIYPSGLKLSRSVLTLRTGKTSSLRTTVTPRNTDFKTVTWVSSNSAVATVDAKGKVKAIATGTATITVTTSHGLSASCTVTVQ